MYLIKYLVFIPKYFVNVSLYIHLLKGLRITASTVGHIFRRHIYSLDDTTEPQILIFNTSHIAYR